MMQIKKYLVPVILTFLLATFLVIAPVAAVDQVSTADDWQKYVLDKAGNHEDINVVLAGDITINATAGTESGYLKNVKIDGNGHTITLILNDGMVDNVALLGCVKDGNVSISNLKLTGKITMKEKAGKNRAAALIAYAQGGTYTIENVSLDGMDISYGGTVGGLVAYAGKGTNITITGCSIASSTIAASAGYFAGGFLGWAAEGTTVSVKDCKMTGSEVSGAKVPSGGIAGCLAGTSDISGCTISDSCIIYSAYGQNGGLVGYLKGNLNVSNTTVTGSSIFSTAVPAKNQGVSTRAVVTNKNVGVGGFIGEMSTDKDDKGNSLSSLTVSGSTISSCQILSNRGDMVQEVVGNGYSGTTVPGVTLTDNTVREISKETDADIYTGRVEQTKASTPIPLLGILAGLGIAGLVAARKRK